MQTSIFDSLKPSYSLADLFKDLNNGMADTFLYNGNEFKVKRYGLKWVVTDPKTGFTATQSSYINCMLDLQGMGACLLEYKRDLIFDRNGDIQN